ncbi:ABC-three component system protein [Sphingomonas sp. XXL09]|uniref:ABC-three component system protein n=1 Tax=Sphingomonas sp. XXL09 TaxID=3457787 RepID=UPI00406BD92E
MSKGLITNNKADVIQQGVTANVVAAGSAYVLNVEGPKVNPGLQKLVAKCLAEIETGEVQDTFIAQLAHFNRAPSDRNLKTKLSDAGQTSDYYDFAIEAKESFAKFFEVTARHPSGQAILVAGFKHAYSTFQESIRPSLGSMTFSQQSAIFNDSVVEYLSHNLTGLPEFYGKMEALGLIFFLADSCFIEYAKC